MFLPPLSSYQQCMYGKPLNFFRFLKFLGRFFTMQIMVSFEEQEERTVAAIAFEGSLYHCCLFLVIQANWSISVCIRTPYQMCYPPVIKTLFFKFVGTPFLNPSLPPKMSSWNYLILDTNWFLSFAIFFCLSRPLCLRTKIHAIFNSMHVYCLTLNGTYHLEEPV